MWQKAIWMGHPVRLELSCEGLLVQHVNFYTTGGALARSKYLFISSFFFIFILWFCCRLNQSWFTIYEIQWTNETLFYKNISLILSSKGAHNLLLVWQIDGETYTQRRDLYLSHIFFREPGAANALHPVASRVVRKVRDASDRLRVPGSTLDSLPLSKSDRIVITWSPSVYTPVGPDCHDALSPPCLLITTWQLVKAHGVTRNEPNIHVICYITVCRNGKLHKMSNGYFVN